MVGIRNVITKALNLQAMHDVDQKKLSHNFFFCVFAKKKGVAK